MILNTIPRVSLVVLLCTAGSAIAQQTATASFPTSQSASAALPSPAADLCTRQVSVSCTKPPRPFVKRKASHKPSTAPAPQYDALAIHPNAAIRDTKAKETVLPGVMVIAGSDSQALDFTKARKLSLTNGSNEVVYLSDVDQNRIQLPFVNPKIIGTEEITVDKRPSSNNVYIQFKDNVTRPVQVYIEQPGGSGAVYGLQLTPKKIPAQTIIIRDNSLLEGESIAAPKGNDYVASTQFLMETVALGASPQGFSQLDVKIAPIAMNGLVVSAEKMFSSADRDIYVYDVMNPGGKTLTLREEEFNGDSVLAISIFPKPLLAGGEHAKVFVIARKQKGR